MGIFYLICQDWRTSSYFAAYLWAADEDAARAKATNFEETKYGKQKFRKSQKVSYRLLNAEQFWQEFQDCTYWCCYFVERYGRVCKSIILAASQQEAIAKFEELWPDKKVISSRPDEKRTIFWADLYKEPEENQVTRPTAHPEQLAIAI
jgi:hypothetical protein